MMLASFHMCGMVLVLRARLKVLVRYVRPSGPFVLKVSDANAIRSCGVVVFAVPDGS